MAELGNTRSQINIVTNYTGFDWDAKLLFYNEPSKRLEPFLKYKGINEVFLFAEGHCVFSLFNNNSNNYGKLRK